ncbi:hypothetical protein [Shewanella putrefaciens]|uniref:hypothetical protein n=1 Tax=Shewanella putrefaciens TaxID=24 RepID=UPI003D7B0508
MSLLAGLGQGLQGAGQAIGQGLYAYAMAMREDERERMRQASIEKRWAVEDARYDKAQEKDDQRYNDRNAKDDARYKDSVKFREQDAIRANAREGRQDEKQSAMMLGQSLERLESIKKDKAKEIAEMFTDPMTKQVIDQEAYRTAMADLNKSYIEDAGKIVQRSGLSDDQINKYGFSMFLPEPITPEPTATNDPALAVPAATDKPSFDISGWANGVRQPQSGSNSMPKQGETKREMAVDYLLNDRGDTTRKPGLLSPETIAQQQERLKKLRESGVQSAYGAAMMPR